MVAVLWLLTIAAYPHLPADVPGHFSIRGEPDLWVPKWVGIAPAPAISFLFVIGAGSWSPDAPLRRTWVLGSLLVAQATVIAYSLGCGRWSLVPPVAALLAFVWQRFWK